MTERRSPIFEPQINPELDALIVDKGRYVEIEKGSYFVKPGDSLCEISYIYKGSSLHSIYGSSGKEKASYMLTHGWFLAEGLFSNFKEFSKANRYSLALTQMVLYKFNKDTYDELMEFQIFRDAMIRSLSEKLDFLRTEQEQLSIKLTKDRLKDFFTMIINPEQITDDGWYPLTEKFTHQLIASLIGVNRVTVSRLIGELANENFLRVLNRNIQINAEAVPEEQEYY